MKKIVLVLLVVCSTQLALAGNGGGVGVGKVSFNTHLESDSRRSSQSAIRVVDVLTSGLRVEIEINGNIRQTYLSYDSLENAKAEFIQALGISAGSGGGWVEL